MKDENIHKELYSGLIFPLSYSKCPTWKAAADRCLSAAKLVGVTKLDHFSVFTLFFDLFCDADPPSGLCCGYSH